MKEELVTFETAKLAKEKGFDWKCAHWKSSGELTGHLLTILPMAYYPGGSDLIRVPTQSLLQKWFYEKHGIFIYVVPDDENDDKFIVWVYYKEAVNWGGFNYYNYILCNDEGKIISYETPKETLEEGLQEALKLIEQE